VPGVQVVRQPSPEGRLRNAALDALALPFVFVGPRRTMNALGARIPLHYEWRRWTWRNERCAEIALGRHVLSGRDPSRVIELGNVLPLAGLGGHTVIDKYERGEGVVNVDILEYVPRGRFDLAISISTLEHVGWDEDPRDSGKAAVALERLAELADDLLVTVPVAYHPGFEDAFVEGPFDRVELLVKTARDARWTPRPLAERSRIRFSAPYANANGILVGTRGLAPPRQA
jgi:hypothetical protein